MGMCGDNSHSSWCGSLSDVKGPVHCTVMFVGCRDGLSKHQSIRVCKGALESHKPPYLEIPDGMFQMEPVELVKTHIYSQAGGNPAVSLPGFKGSLKSSH